MWPSAWACRSSGWSSPPTTTTSSPGRVETGIYETRGVHATSSPSMDIQVSSNFERYLFEASGRDATLIRNHDGEPVRSRAGSSSVRRRRLKSDFAAAAASETDVAAAIRKTARRKRLPCRSAYRVRHRCGGTYSRPFPGGHRHTFDRPSGEVPRRHGRELRYAAGVAAAPFGADDGTGALRRARQRRRSVEAYVAARARIVREPREMTLAPGRPSRNDARERHPGRHSPTCRIWKRWRSASGSRPAPVTSRRARRVSRTSSSTWPSRARSGVRP